MNEVGFEFDSAHQWQAAPSPLTEKQTTELGPRTLQLLVIPSQDSLEHFFP